MAIDRQFIVDELYDGNTAITAQWLWFFPGALILLSVLSANFIGDGLRDALDPYSIK